MRLITRSLSCYGPFFRFGRPFRSSQMAYTEGFLNQPSIGGLRMNQAQKEMITKMRGDGASYKRIAISLSISENTVQSFCRRNGLGGSIAVGVIEGIHCRNCGARLVHTKGAKRRKFCSDVCRMAWWNAHPELVQRKTVRTFSCEQCGIQFQSYGNRIRKHCSRTCYGRAKTPGVCHE